jgi:hypothetical protein
MIVALLSIIVLVFVVSVLAQVSQPDLIPPMTNSAPVMSSAPTAEAFGNEPKGTNTEPAFDIVEAERLFLAARDAPAAPQPTHTIAPFEAFDTVGLQQIESSRGLATVAQAVFDNQRKREPLDLECSAAPQPCAMEPVWNNTFQGCGTFHVPAKAKNYPFDPRVWQGDLNPKLQERQALMAKEWDPYQHFRGRQAMLQFLSTNLNNRKDPYTRPIDDLDAVDLRCLNEIEPTALY